MPLHPPISDSLHGQSGTACRGCAGVSHGPRGERQRDYSPASSVPKCSSSWREGHMFRGRGSLRDSPVCLRRLEAVHMPRHDLPPPPLTCWNTRGSDGLRRSSSSIPRCDTGDVVYRSCRCRPTIPSPLGERMTLSEIESVLGPETVLRALVTSQVMRCGRRRCLHGQPSECGQGNANS